MQRPKATLLWSASLIAGLWPHICLGGQDLRMDVSADTVERYARVEFALPLDTAYANPFDADEVDVRLEFVTPSGRKLTLPGFYYQDYERQDKRETAEWLYPVGEPVWKARFAPAEVGAYSCRATLTDRNGTRQSGPAEFQCVPSRRRGYVRVSPRDPRFLEFDDGTPFFAIGQNVAFVKNTYRVEDIFRKMADNGANFARIWTCCSDYAMAIEARKSAWGTSWSWNPPIVARPGSDGYDTDVKCVKLSGGEGATLTASPHHPVAVRPHTRYVVFGSVRTEPGVGAWLEINGEKVGEPLTGTQQARTGRVVPSWSAFQRQFTSKPDQWWLGPVVFRLSADGNAWLMDLSLREADGGPELPWGADPNRPFIGYYNAKDSYMLDKVVEAAEQDGIYLELCIATRDIYMHMLRDDSSPEYDKAVKQIKPFLRYCVARWGYSTNVAMWEYWNEQDPGLPTDRCYTELGEYLEQIDPYHHLRATSAWHPSPRDWRHPKLDTADIHFYLRPDAKEGWQDEVAAVLDRAGFTREQAPDKPAMFAEFGLAGADFGFSPRTGDDVELVHVHNALWASALSGISSTTCLWWWDEYDKMDVYRHYRPLASFVADIPFTTAKLHRASAMTSDSRLRIIGLQGSECAYLWLFNQEATWSRLALEKAVPTEVRGASVRIAGLARGSYQVQWWDTHDGRVVQRASVLLSDGALTLEVPVLSRDIACKVSR